MTATFDFDRLLESVLVDAGPQVAPHATVDAAIERTGSVRQNRPIVKALDRNAWPASRISLAHPVTARFVLVGLVILLTIALAGATILVGSRLLGIDSGPSFLRTGSMTEARTVFTATLLLDGTVLAVGGGISESSGNTDSAELYDPGSGTWSPTSPLTDRRSWQTATILRDGTVLVAGGGGENGSLASAELYDPATGVWIPTGSMSEPRTQHVATRLADGRVLVAGGTGGSDPALFAEVYDPGSGSWTTTGPMTEWRASPTVTLLPTGQVLVAGGFGNGLEITSAELFDPASQTWTATGSMHESRVDGTSATLLLDGRVLVVGGANGGGPVDSGSSAELYDPVTGSWTVTASTSAGQGGHTASLLPDGTVLVAGGIGGDGVAVVATQTYDPRTASWTSGPPLVEARYSGIAVTLADGRILVMGGTGEYPSEAALSSAELYVPGPRAVMPRP